jgi:hypothetical protein
MDEAAQAAKLWADFHHLTEFDQNLVLNYAKTIEISLKCIPCQKEEKSGTNESCNHTNED